MSIKGIMEIFEHSKNVDFLKQDIENNRFINLDLLIEYFKNNYGHRLDWLINELEDYYKNWEN